MTIRKALESDVNAVAAIYRHIHAAEQRGEVTIGWDPQVYPIRSTAEKALKRGDLFVMELENTVVASAIINQIQPEGYPEGHWLYSATDDEVMVLHTLVVEPTCKHSGLGKAFVAFYEDYARQQGCKVLRMDTQAKNTIPMTMYPRLGYRIAGNVGCNFNGIPVDKLVLFEKKIQNAECKMQNTELSLRR